MDYDEKPTRRQWVRDWLYASAVIGGAWLVVYAAIGVIVLLVAGFMALVGAGR